MFELELMVVFSNVFVEVCLQVMVGRNGCGIGLVRVKWRHAGENSQIRETLC